MPSENYNTIKNAILQKKNISAQYKGHIREMTPHILGTKEGKEQCLFYQFGGSSSSSKAFHENSPQNWRCLTINQLERVEIIDGYLKTCDQHSKEQTCVDTVDIQMDTESLKCYCE